MLLVALAMFGVFFYISLFMQQVLGFSPTQAGASFLPMTVLIILIAPLPGSSPIGSARAGFAGRRHVPARGLALPLLAAGHSLELLAAAAGNAHRRDGDGADDDADHRCGDVVGAADKAGVGSAVLNSMRQVGGSLGIAIIGSDRRLGPRERSAGRRHAAGRVRERPPPRARGRLADRARRARSSRSHGPEGRTTPEPCASGARAVEDAR